MKIMSKVVTVVIMITTALALTAVGVFSEDAGDRLAREQIKRYGSRWIIKSVASESALSSLLNTVEINNDFERKFWRDLIEKREGEYAYEKQFAINKKGAGYGGKGNDGSIDIADYKKFKDELKDLAGDNSVYFTYNETIMEWIYKVLKPAFEEQQRNWDNEDYHCNPNYDFDGDGRLDGGDIMLILSCQAWDTITGKLLREAANQRGRRPGDSGYEPFYDRAGPSDPGYSTGYRIEGAGTEYGVGSMERENGYLAAGGSALKPFSPRADDRGWAKAEEDDLEYQNLNGLGLDPDLYGEVKPESTGPAYITIETLSTSNKESLEEVFTGPEGRSGKIPAKEAIDETANAFIRDEDYVDRNTRKGFLEALYLANMMKTFEDVLEGIDFSGLTGAFNGLMEEQKALYKQYLAKTAEAYEQISVLLTIDMKEIVLPEKYLKTQLSERGKRKLMVDLTLEELAEEKRNTLKKSEREALRIYRNVLQPLKRRYMEDLKLVLQEFTFEVRKTFIDSTSMITPRE